MTTPKALQITIRKPMIRILPTSSLSFRMINPGQIIVSWGTHTPHTPPDSLLGKYLPDAPSESVAKYWAMIDWFDITVSQLLGSTDERSLTENTLVIYLADNGWIQNPEQNGFAWPSKQSPYDILFILVDDLGWKDMGSYDSEFYEKNKVELYDLIREIGEMADIASYLAVEFVFPCPSPG